MDHSHEHQNPGGPCSYSYPFSPALQTTLRAKNRDRDLGPEGLSTDFVEMPVENVVKTRFKGLLNGDFLHFASFLCSLSRPRLPERHETFNTDCQQPVAKVVTAFDRPCTGADCVAIRAHTPGMRAHSALSGGRRNGLGARETFTTDC